MMEDVEAIVAKLTKAQREAVMALPVFIGIRTAGAEANRKIAGVSPSVQNALINKELAYCRASGIVGLSPLGQSVRTYLLSQTKE